MTFVATATGIYYVEAGAFSDTGTGTYRVGVSATAPLNHAPMITSDGGGDTATLARAENTTTVTPVAATDQDAGTSLVYSIIGGADAAKFHVDASTGVLSFVTAPNFEAPTDSDHNNSYIVQVGASDGSLFDSQTITVNVTNVNEPPKDFNGDGYSDLLWQNDNGTLGAWDLNDQQILHSFNFTAVSNDGTSPAPAISTATPTATCSGAATTVQSGSGT